ncbi:MAG: sialate O-acetylesterase [Clostridia bacterium]
MKFEKIISVMTVISIVFSILSSFTVLATETEMYSCDFTRLVKNSADTTYGTANDIIKIDSYTTAYLTYNGSYVSADGKVFLKGKSSTCAYTDSSYIEFTAPADGTVTCIGADNFNYSIDGGTRAYSKSITPKLQKGQILRVWYRVSGTAITSLNFQPDEKPAETTSPTEQPSETPSTQPEREVIYSENFEGYNVGDNGGWTSPAGTMSIKSDNTSSIGKYQTVVSGKSGTCRSGYVEIPKVIDQNFVFECDFKSNSNVNVSDLELLENKSSVYANHGRYSNAKYAFTMARPKNSNLYVINNATDDSGLTLDSYTQPSVTTKEITDNPWLHIKVIGNFDNHTAIAYITSLDQKTIYYHGMTDISPDISSWKCIHLLSPSTNSDTCIDNIKISKALSSDLAEQFHTVKINDGISEFSQYVFSGESAVNIPDMSIYGAAFEGWNINSAVKTTAELEKLPIKADTVITAKISDSYIENIASVEFNDFPTDNLLVMGADGDTYADNNISLTITGERGTSIVANPDARVTDYKIDWKFDGFRIMGGKPTGETGFVYCDSYGLCEITDKAQTAVNFKLKNTAENYYGQVTATVTYNNKTLSVSKPLLLLAYTNRDGAVILPKAGYTADYNKYDSALVGYTASKDDILTGGWSTDGSDVSHITLNSDNTGKYLSLTRDASGNSSYIYNTVGNITSQTVFSQDVRFGMDASIEYGADTAKGTATAFNSTAFTLSLSGSSITLNGSAVCNGEKNKWYHIEITADPTTKLCFAKIYNLRSDGDYSNETPIATTQTVSLKDGYTSGAYYRITLAKDKSNSVDINNVTVTAAQVDESSINVTAPETITIPSSGTTTAELSVLAKVVGGDNAIGMASWEIADETSTGVSIASKDANSATLTVDSTASSGEFSIRVTINGISVIKKIKLIGTQNNIVFTSSPTGVMIPASSSMDYTYTAEIRNGNGDKIDGAVSYSLYNADNSSVLNASGISISDSGVLTVTSSANPQTIYVRATSGALTRSVKVSVYGLKFDFGTNAPANGYTSVTSQTLYSENLGYGIIGTATDNADKLSGSDFGFKVKLEKGEVYKVTAKYKGTIKCEKIDSSLSGFERTKSALEADTYNTAVFGDGVLDITLSGAGEFDSISIEKVERTANSKPAWWTIGDSTVQQNGSWAYTLNNTLSAYTKLNNTISAFYNSGQAGRQHKSYYSEGLLNNVLCGIKPGDVVSISGMGTNDSSSTKEQFKAYNNAYIDAVEDMGAYVILGSYTPTGNYGATQGKVYDSDNVLFKGMRTNAYDAAIREIYAERKNDDKILGFIDIGQIADNLMTNDVRTAYNAAADNGKTIAEARAAANEKATELMAMWKDYNHYYTDFSNYILLEVTNRVAQLILGEIQSDIPSVIDLKTVSSNPTTPPTTLPTTSPTDPPSQDKNINILEKSIIDGNIIIKIDKGFNGTAIAAMYDNRGVLKQILTETDNSKTRDFSFIKSDNITGYTIKLMSWDSLNGMKPIDSPQTITVSDITISNPTPDPSVNSSIEVVSSEEYVDVSSLKMYDNNTYRMYKSDGRYETVTAQNGKVHNTTGSKVTVVPEYKFDLTQDGHIAGFVKVGVNSYTEEKGYGLLNGVDYSIDKNGCRPIDGRPIKADVPSGFYDITVYREGGVRADVYSEGIQIINNTTSNGSQNRPSGSAVMFAPSVNIEKGADITFGNVQGNGERISSIEIVRVPNQYRKPVIWVAGDSESANYYPIDADGSDLDSNKIMMTGFGMQLSKFLSDKYRVANWGQPSATAGTWNSECLEAVSRRMQKGDTILIDFGINDAISSSNKVDVDTAKANIKAIVEAAKAAEVTPILISPVYNSKYQHRTYFTYNKASDSNILSDFAKELEVGFIDLNKYTMLYTDEAKAQTGDENWITNNYHVGDNLHMTQHSALLDASFICAEMKKMGYETTDYSYTYKDISSIGENSTRGTESGVTRVYSIAEAEKFIAANAAPEEIYSKVWDFETDQTASSGNNVIVISGSALWNEANKNIKFDANTKDTGALSLTLDPAANGDIVKTTFDLNIGALGGQIFSYDISDNEGNKLADVSIDAYNSKATVKVSKSTVADNQTISTNIAKDDGMKAGVTQVINEIDFSGKTVKITIGQTTFTGNLTGAETGTVKTINIKSERSKTAGRSIYLDNLSVKAYKSANSGDETETAFPAFEKKVYTSQDGITLPYRISAPENVSDNIPVLVYLHGETRKGNDNESQLYNAQYMFDEIEKSETDCILIAPQCPSDSEWTDISEIVAELAHNIESADSDRIYIAGYGEGANACYDLLETGMFAAAVPISGTGNVLKAQTIANTNAAVMAFNGSEETENARDMIKALITAGAKNAEYSEIYGESSNIQEQTAKSGVIEWLFAKSKNAEETAKTVDLAIFMGQSNMAGRGEYEDAVYCPVGHGYEFRSVTEPDMLFNITGPFGKKENNDTVNDNSGAGVDRRSGDMVSALMESYYSQTGTPIVGVQCSRGGTNLGYWNSAAQKAEAQSRLTAAKTYLEDNGYTINHIFMVWCQGEADADKLHSGSQSIEGYKSSTLSVFNYMKEVGVTDMFVVKTGHYNGSDDTDGAHDAAYVSVNSAQEELAQETENVYTVGSFLEYQSSMKDSYHFHQNAYNEVGTAAGKAIAQIYN